MEYRELSYDEIDQIWNIDRTEHVKSIYLYDNGKLKEKIIDKTFYGWPEREPKSYGEILKECFKAGGFFWGAFENKILKAIVVLDNKWLGKNKKTLQLKFLHIDRSLRKMGI